MYDEMELRKIKGDIVHRPEEEDQLLLEYK